MAYDSKTEALTQRGFVPWPEVKEDDLLATWDCAADSVSYEAPLCLTKHWHSGQFYRVVHKGIDLCVTPSHMMFVSRKRTNGGKQEWGHPQLVSAETLEHRTLIKYLKRAPNRNSESLCQHSLATLRLFGVFLGDSEEPPLTGDRLVLNFGGPLRHAYRLVSDACLLLGVGVSPLEGRKCSLSLPNIAEGFANECYDASLKQKVIPEWIASLGQESIAVIEGLLASKGCESYSVGRIFGTESEQLANSIQHLMVNAGLSTSLRIQKGKSGKSLYRVMTFSGESIVNQSREDTSFIKSSEFVYSAKTRTGVVVVRRNGHVVLCGSL